MPEELTDTIKNTPKLLECPLDQKREIEMLGEILMAIQVTITPVPAPAPPPPLTPIRAAILPNTEPRVTRPGKHEQRGNRAGRRANKSNRHD